MKNRIVEFNENISITESNAAEWESKLVGDVEISGGFTIHSAASFDKLTSLKVGADFTIYSAASFAKLTSLKVGADFYIDTAA